MDVSSWDQVLRQVGLHNPFLVHLVEGMETRGSVALGGVLEGFNLGLKLLVE